MLFPGFQTGRLVNGISLSPLRSSRLYADPVLVPFGDRASGALRSGQLRARSATLMGVESLVKRQGLSMFRGQETFGALI